jgi:hypothetical protein
MPPANSNATCTAGACGFNCNSGFAKVGGSACDVVAPRPLAPLSATYVGSWRPTLKWSLPTGVTAARIDLCTSRACTTQVGGFPLDVPAASFTFPADLTPGVYWWRLHGIANTTSGNVVGTQTSATWEFFVPAHSGTVVKNTSYGPVPDFNGDGYADIVNGGSQNGNFIYPGSSSGPPTSATGGGSQSQSLCAAGDLNGDGFGDLFVGEISGMSQVYYGSASGLVFSSSTQINLVSASIHCGAVGDVDGDGYADVGVSISQQNKAWVYTGGSGGLATTASYTFTDTGSASFGGFGQAITGGDFNGDGVDDVLVGETFQDTGGIIHGNALVWNGKVGGPVGGDQTTAKVLLGPGNAQFGGTLTNAGDVNGDGYVDAVIGTPNSKNPKLFLGSSSGLPLSASQTITISQTSFYMPVSGGHDLDGDGFDDLIVGVDGSNGFDYYLSNGTSFVLGATQVIGASGSGQKVALVGDTNGDGRSDAVVGTWGNATNEFFNFYYGAATAPVLPTTASLSFMGPQNGWGNQLQ